MWVALRLFRPSMGMYANCHIRLSRLTPRRIAFGAFIGLLPSTAATLGPIHTVGERIGFQLTFMSIAILIGSPIAGAVQARPLGYTGAGIYAGK
jgi:hypothetical protein